MPPTTPNRFPDEVERLELAAELECYLNPLAARCDELEAAPALSAADQLLHDQLTGLLGALYRYDQATDSLLVDYRHALERAERPAEQPTPTLEAALLAKLSPADLLAYREADPVYRLGYVRGHKKGSADMEAKYQHLSSLYAQHALLVPPLSYKPSPVIARVKAWLAARLMNGHRLPLATRQLLFNQTPTTRQHGA